MSSAVCYSMQYGTGIDNRADGEHFSGNQWMVLLRFTYRQRIVCESHELYYVNKLVCTR
jgi:hypothetical protein